MVSTLFGDVGKFSFDAGLEQAFEAVFDGIPDEFSTLAGVAQELSVQPVKASLIVTTDTHPQNALCLSSPHGQKTVRGTLGKLLREVEIVTVFLRLLFPFLFFLLILCLGLHLDRGNNGILLEVETYNISGFFTFTHLFSDNVVCTLYGFLDACHALLLADKLFGFLVHIGRWVLHQQESCQWFQALLTSHLSTSLAFGFERQVDIFQFRAVPGCFNTSLQLGSQFALFLDGFQDGLLAFCQLIQLLQLVAHTCHLNLVKRTCHFFSVSTDERDGAPLFQ